MMERSRARMSRLFLLAGLVACSRPAPAPDPRDDGIRVPEARLPEGAVERLLAASRAREQQLAATTALEAMEQRFRRMNLVAMGRHPDTGRPIYTSKNESAEFRQLAGAMRSELGDAAVDTLGEVLADRGLDALLDASGAFRVPMSPEGFAGERVAPEALEILALTRDLPLLLVHHGLVGDGGRSALPRFTVRTLLRVRWNLETGKPQDWGLETVERIAYLEFLGRYKRWASLAERRWALQQLAALLPDYPLEEALGATLVDRVAPAPIVVEEGP